MIDNKLSLCEQIVVQFLCTILDENDVELTVITQDLTHDCVITANQIEDALSSLRRCKLVYSRHVGDRIYYGLN